MEILSGTAQKFSTAKMERTVLKFPFAERIIHVLILKNAIKKLVSVKENKYATTAYKALSNRSKVYLKGAIKQIIKLY